MNTYRNFAFAVLTGIAVLTAALPMTATPQPMSVDIPFDFYVAGKLLPGGTYTVAVSDFGAAIHVSDSRGNSAFALALGRVHLPANQGKSQLLFKKYGDIGVLSGVSGSDSDDTLVIPTPAVEELIARKSGAPKSVAVSRK
jgi:hypothetical protein